MKRNKAKKDRQSHRTESITKALQAAKKGHRDRFLHLLNELALEDRADVPISERWLIAERNHLLGNRRKAFDQFLSIRSDRGFENLHTWQKYVCFHRCALSALRLGDLKSCEELLSEAENMCKTYPELDARSPDIQALRAFPV